MRKLFRDFIGSRILPPDFRNFLISQRKIIPGVLYRGISYPKHLLVEGNLIEEWYGSSHWSYSEEVARRFSRDYINEDYREDLIEELGKENVEFVSLILVGRDLEGVAMAPFLKQYSLLDDYGDEQEVTVLDRNFRIESIEERNVNSEHFTFAYITAVTRQ